jgi:hypothetical protein
VVSSQHWPVAFNGSFPWRVEIQAGGLPGTEEGQQVAKSGQTPPPWHCFQACVVGIVQRRKEMKNDDVVELTEVPKEFTVAIMMPCVMETINQEGAV